MCPGRQSECGIRNKTIDVDRQLGVSECRYRHQVVNVIALQNRTRRGEFRSISHTVRRDLCPVPTALNGAGQTKQKPFCSPCRLGIELVCYVENFHCYTPEVS